MLRYIVAAHIMLKHNMKALRAGGKNFVIATNFSNKLLYRKV